MSDLEQAADPSRLRRVAIEPLTRVEGHGKVTILLDEQQRVHQVRLHIVEFRGFERFIVGRPYWEVPVVVQRLCGICPVSHHLAACKALDAVAGAPVIPATAQALRRLMHYGQILQSHALHFYHLAAPDLLLGYDSAVAQRHIGGLLAAHPEVARRGVMLRKFGQEVIRATAGKRIHGTGSIPGGVNQALDSTDREALRAAIPAVLDWAREGVELATALHAAAPEHHARFGCVPSHLLSLVDTTGALDLYDGVLRVRTASGELMFDGIAVADYTTLLQEDVRSWSYMKFPYLTAYGPESGWYKVGPLARLQTCDRIPTPLAEAERQRLLATTPTPGELLHGPLLYHRARLIELLHAAEVLATALADDTLLGTDGPLHLSGPGVGSGVGVIEAPRGTLIHHYEVDEHNLIARCNLIVSTTHNNQAMNEAIREVARRELDHHEPTPALLNHIEIAIRAFDPCLSCATHALGRMPLQVAAFAASGELAWRLERSSDPTT